MTQTSGSSGAPLDVVQRWMQAVITHPGGVEQGARSTAARMVLPDSAGIGEVIERSRTLTSSERLAVYANAYLARLVEVLENDFPAVKYAVGDEAFPTFCLEYLQQVPSRSDTLGDLGREFPAFLKRTRPLRTSEQPEPDWADFLVDLASLERTYSEVFDGPGIERRPAPRVEDLAELTPERWLQTRLRMAPCFRLSTFAFPVHEYATAVRMGKKPQWPEPRGTRLVITRKDYVVRRKAVEPAEFAVLSSLAEGQTVGEALWAAINAFPDEIDGLPRAVRTWFSEWSAAGYFVGWECGGHDQTSAEVD